MTGSSFANRQVWLAFWFAMAWAAPGRRYDRLRRDVRPILAANCLKCHGPDEQKASLRLDAVALAVEGGNHGAAIVQGKAR